MGEGSKNNERQEDKQQQFVHDAEAPIPIPTRRPKPRPNHGLPWPGRARPSGGNLPFLWCLIAQRSRSRSALSLSLSLALAYRPAEYDRASAVIIIKLLLWHTNRLYCSRVIVRQCFQFLLRSLLLTAFLCHSLLLLLHFAQMKNVAVYFHLEFFYCGGGGGGGGALNIICCINVGHMHMKIGNTQRTHTGHIHSFCLISM